MKIIRMIYPVIGIMLALMLCITPVAAVSADDFEVVTMKEGRVNSYKYCNMNNPDEEYIEIITDGTEVLDSLVTFKPANIPDAPVMKVYTTRDLLFLHPYTYIYLPRSVDDWEIKYYSRKYDYSDPYLQPDDKYLKNAGVVNLNEFFKNRIKNGLYLELSWDQYITSLSYHLHYWTIPEV